MTSTATDQSAAKPQTSTTRHKPVFLRILAFLQLPTAGLAIWAGGTDLLSAPWLLPRILGLIIFLLALLILPGVVVIFRFRVLYRSGSRLALLGSLSGVVIDVIFMLSALHYSTVRFWLFFLCALPGLAVAVKVFDWELITPYPKLAATAGFAGGLLSVVPFLYSNIYLPSTADVAVESTLTPGAVTTAGPGFDLLNLVITFGDQSSVAAATLTSMVQVYGVTYQHPAFQGTPSQAAAAAVGLGTSLVPNLEFTGARDSTLLTLRRALRDGALINPGVALATSVPVLIPAGKYQELDVQLTLWYARSDRLTLIGPYYGPRLYDRNGNCAADDVRTAWLVSQPQLSVLTRGRETAATDWCASVQSPSAGAFIAGAPGAHTPASVARLEEQSYQTKRTTRFWVIDLPASAK
jgi:hypothetical protein